MKTLHLIHEMFERKRKTLVSRTTSHWLVLIQTDLPVYGYDGVRERLYVDDDWSRSRHTAWPTGLWWWWWWCWWCWEVKAVRVTSVFVVVVWIDRHQPKHVHRTYLNTTSDGGSNQLQRNSSRLRNTCSTDRLWLADKIV